MHPDGTSIKTIDLGTSVTPVEISWSPDSSKILFTSLGQPERNSLYVFDITRWLNEN